jgi:hypothetical protein
VISVSFVSPYVPKCGREAVMSHDWRENIDLDWWGSEDEVDYEDTPAEPVLVIRRDGKIHPTPELLEMLDKVVVGSVEWDALVEKIGQQVTL